MKHARQDYQNIQGILTNGTVRMIPFLDEPVFLIRGFPDVVSGDAVRAWANLAEATGADPEIIKVARQQAEKMDAWPKRKSLIEVAFHRLHGGQEGSCGVDRHPLDSLT